MVDFVKQGFGTTNDGNTARRFFGDPEKTTKFTGLDAGLVRRFAILLQVIASKEQVNIANYREYAKETADLYCSKNMFSRYPIPSTVHTYSCS
jgi:hypothetical protein